MSGRFGGETKSSRVGLQLRQLWWFWWLADFGAKSHEISISWFFSPLDANQSQMQPK